MRNMCKIIRKIRKNGTSLAINIPKEVVEMMQLKENEILEVEIKRVE